MYRVFIDEGEGRENERAVNHISRGPELSPRVSVSKLKRFFW